MPKAIPIEEEIGKRYGRLTVISFNCYLKKPHGVEKRFNCICECGGKTVSTMHNLRQGIAKSCGCERTKKLLARQVTHGKTHTKEYRIWQGIMRRCTDATFPAWPRYGGRGITVCDRWRSSFQTFLDDMGCKPDGDYSVERIDNDKGYSPENCKWADRAEQSRNKCTNRWIEVEGKRLVMTDWAKASGASIGRIRDRIDKLGWSEVDAVSKPRVQYRKLTKDGVSMTVPEWSKALGLKYRTIRGRLDRGWSENDALCQELK